MMSDSMPGESVPIPLREDSNDPGLMVLCHVLSRLSHGLGRPVEAPRIAVLGGAAFRAYFFSPDDNHAFRETHPEVHWRRRSLSVDNYGLPEALAGHSGLNARRWGRLTGRSLVELLRHEREADRAVALRMTRSPDRWLVAETSDEVGGELVVEPGDEAGERAARLVLPLRDAAFLRDSAEAVVEVLTLRPTGEEASVGLARALLGDVLGWAVGHQDIRHELVHDEEALYAAGSLAWKRMAELSTRMEGRSAEGRAFLTEVVREYAAARRAAAQWAAGAGSGDEATGEAAVMGEVRDRADGVAVLLDELASHLTEEAAATALPGLLDAVAHADRRLAEGLAALRDATA